ncbi:SpoIIE family protein phosphatase [Amycolatopsis sp. NPDC004378]
MREAWTRRRGGLALQCLVVGGGYVAGSQLAFAVLDATGAGPTFFPSAGLTVAALCLLPRRAWPAVCASIAAAELVVDLGEGLAPLAATGFAAANTLEPWCGAALLGRFRPGGVRVGTWRGLTRFVVAAVLAAPVVGAAAGATTAVLLGDGDQAWWTVAARWWLGDALGVLVVGTTMLAWAGDRPAAARRRWPGHIGAAVVMGGFAVLVFFADLVVAGYAGALALIWVALRWGLRAVTASGVVIAVVATTATAVGRGPWARIGTGPESGLVHLQMLLALLLVIAVTVDERETAVRDATSAEEQRRHAQSVLETEHAARERASLLHTVADALGATTDIAQVAAVFVEVEEFGDVLSAAAIGVVADGGGLRVWTHNRSGTTTETVVSASAVTCEAETGRTGEPHYAAADHPPPGGSASRGGAAILPLRTSGEPFGFVGLYFRGTRVWVEEQRTVLLTMAAQTAQAVQRVQLYEAEQALRGRAEHRAWQQRLLVEVVAAVSAPGAVAERAHRLVGTLVPVLADFAVIEFGDGEDDAPVVACAHRSPVGRAACEDVMNAGEAGITALATVLATGRALVTPTPAGGCLPDSAATRRAGAAPLIGVPMSGEGRVRGALLLGRTDADRPFAAGDLALANDIATRAVLVLQAAGSAERERSIALTLQTSLLPRRLPAVRDVGIAARYRPSQRNLAIGGDWYDVVTHPDGRVVITIGDVVGHGLPAAAAMGQMRSAATALILAELDPAAVLDRLDRVAARTAGAEHASALVADFDPADGRLRFAVAGHPPPVLITPDGTVALLEQGRSPLLCLPPKAGRPHTELTLLPGSALVCYTDGLIEQRRRPPDEALAALVSAATRHAGRDPGELCDGLLDTLVGELPARDDIAVVCLRYAPVPATGRRGADEPEQDVKPGGRRGRSGRRTSR